MVPGTTLAQSKAVVDRVRDLLANHRVWERFPASLA